MGRAIVGTFVLGFAGFTASQTLMSQLGTIGAIYIAAGAIAGALIGGAGDIAAAIRECRPPANAKDDG